MPLTVANEYLMLSEPFTGTELADRGFISGAVPCDQLDETVDELVVGC